MLNIWRHLNKFELLPVLSNARVSLVPSKWHETFGLTAVEAMAACVPVIVSNMGGLPEVVGDDEGGFVVKAGDVNSILTNIQTLFEDQSTYNEKSMGAKRRAQRLFSQSQYVNNLSACFNDVYENERV